MVYDVTKSVFARRHYCLCCPLSYLSFRMDITLSRYLLIITCSAGLVALSLGQSSMMGQKRHSAESGDDTVFSSGKYHDYIVVGAGPSGLQLGYFLQRAGRDYLILEKGDSAGTFYKTYPRHRKLISINKRYTGKTNKEYNMRHDWNSLLSDDESLRMTRYSEAFFPSADIYVQYLNDFARKLRLKIQHGVNVQRIWKTGNKKESFYIRDQHGNVFTCRYLVVATGIWVPNEPDFVGKEHVTGYENMTLNLNFYRGKTVLILGKGNSAFETADYIQPVTNFVHLFSRSRVKLAWETHYVGDLRAINNGLIDTYQLKALDGVLYTDINNMQVIKQGDRFSVRLVNDTEHRGLHDNFAARSPYDVIIRALGFHFDASIFHRNIIPKLGEGEKKKYPAIKPNYESMNVEGLFFAGTNTHSLDFRKSAGGFIHGFRYTTRALHHLLEWRNHKIPWPSTALRTTQVMNTLLKRMNEASGLYQMYSVLGDIIIVNDTGAVYLEEVPVQLLPQLETATGHLAPNKVIVMVMEFGKNFSGPGTDPLRRGTATTVPKNAHLAGFLHPVLYYYSHLPTDDDMLRRPSKWILPRPTRLHHVIEDFLFDFSSPVSHVLHLRRFLDTVFGYDTRNYFAGSCFKMAMTHTSVPKTCQDQYLRGEGLTHASHCEASAVTQSTTK
ncbi:FAD-dependent oxidoreductase domain-containing protein 2-like isoform X2 [Branchiostoma floridae x Branchiostoma japonicum]